MAVKKSGKGTETPTHEIRATGGGEPRSEDRRGTADTNTLPAGRCAPGVPTTGLLILAVLGLVVLWAQWPALKSMVERWSSDARYSHGFLVPVFSGFLLYRRRGLLCEAAVGVPWLALALAAVGAAMKLTAAFVYFEWLGAISLLPTLAAMVALVWGRAGLRWAWPSVVFLIFMIPLPFRVETALGSPLQRIAAESSGYLLQTLGVPALVEGNVIDVDGQKLGVIEACNGLGMLFTFLAVTTGTVILIRRPLPERLLILLSSVPAALLANILRITGTGLVLATAGSEWADHVFHDLAGWLMMPVAMGIVWAELRLLTWLVIEVPTTTATRPNPVGPLPTSGRGHP